jgi:predicted RNA-binding Zn ribbon-like protein
MALLFLGSHPAVDFLNTAYAPDGEPVETIPDGKALLEWMAGAGLLEAAEAARLQRRFGAKALDEVAAEARSIREWTRSWLERWRAEPKRDYRDDLAALNKLLTRETRTREVVAGKRGFELIERRRLAGADDLLAMIGAQIAALVTREKAAMLKSCAGTGCTLWFLDRTKAHRRMFCSASACGNRAKVAAFRRRQRE